MFSMDLFGGKKIIMAIYGAINGSMGEFYKPSLCAHYRRVLSIISLIFFVSVAHL